LRCRSRSRSRSICALSASLITGVPSHQPQVARPGAGNV
jgi:hypothetical protein